ncbi:Serine acetyltransferase [Alphaproteobacteria bacterium SO-S41]|nr:Serine acetyltransferase [Alphaproteobacteria bacterium SO-S41]
MSVAVERIANLDPVWSSLRAEAESIAVSEPALASFVHGSILAHARLEDALSFHLANKLANADTSAMKIRDTFQAAFAAAPEIGQAVRADLSAIRDRDPASRGFVQPFLFFKGFQALQSYRIAHWLWKSNRTWMAMYFQNRISEVFGADIHPAARIGRGVFIDHATGVVIGETAVVEDDVSMLHGVTLGGSGKERGDRHPKVRKGVMIGASATILGNIEVGEYSRVGAGSVVLQPVPANCTVAGVPAKVVGCAGCDNPSHAMNQNFLDQIVSDFDI